LRLPPSKLISSCHKDSHNLDFDLPLEGDTGAGNGAREGDLGIAEPKSLSYTQPIVSLPACDMGEQDSFKVQRAGRCAPPMVRRLPRYFFSPTQAPLVAGGGHLLLLIKHFGG